MFKLRGRQGFVVMYGVCLSENVGRVRYLGSRLEFDAVYNKKKKNLQWSAETGQVYHRLDLLSTIFLHFLLLSFVRRVGKRNQEWSVHARFYV